MGQNTSRTARSAVASNPTAVPLSTTTTPMSQSNSTWRSTIRRGLLKLVNSRTPGRPSKTSDTEASTQPSSTAIVDKNVDIKGKGRASDEIIGEEQTDELGSTSSGSSLSRAGSFSPASSSSSTSTSPSNMPTPPPRTHQNEDLPEEPTGTTTTCFSDDETRDLERRIAAEEVVISPEPTFADVTQHITNSTEVTPSAAASNLEEDRQTIQAPQQSAFRPPSQGFPSLSAPTLPSPANARQFPPPGTLVVVQGVVHTTNVTPPQQQPPSPRTTSTSHRSSSIVGANFAEIPTPARANSLENGARSRLSALLPRTRPVSAIPASETRNGESYDEELEGEGSEGLESTQGINTREDAQSAATPGSGPISSSSIDVLGTLLSVAAAATAASLLTGSSEPIFSSGLTPANASDEPSSPSVPSPSARPMSPTPTAGLGTLGLGIAEGQNREQGGRDRMRNVWGSLRERLGLRASGPTSSPLDSLPSAGVGSEPSSTTGSPTQTDAREAMLAEMARAFNLGLGLPNAVPGSPTVPGPYPAESQNDGLAPGVDATFTSVPRLPPANSFERFLVDLQTDLRTTLSQPAEIGAESQSTNEARESTPLNPDSLTERDANSDEQSLSTSSNSGERYTDAVNETTATPEESSAPQQDTPVDTPGGDDDNSSQPTTTPSSGPRSAGEINWWRLYRFPAISAPQAQNLATSTPGSPQPPPTSDATASSTERSSPIPDSSPQPSPSTRSVPTAASVVIPVIVVGLQSVNRAGRRRNRRPDMPAAPSQGEDAFGADDEPAPVEMEEDDDLADFPAPLGGDDGGEIPNRGSRRWRSRAADAFRNLRPGRRNDRDSQMPPTGAGSRTFLIYVIGGYYPPDHQIVTGAGPLDSFDALWELAELLGQVKAPTTSKDELEKSGLEIIKPPALSSYEEEGKVASNCVERCLICLDDYEAVDDLRIMACKHVFHKTCVDKWMLTGRNNCPACRTKGVSTPEPATES